MKSAKNKLKKERNLSFPLIKQEFIFHQNNPTPI